MFLLWLWHHHFKNSSYYLSVHHEILENTPGQHISQERHDQKENMLASRRVFKDKTRQEKIHSVYLPVKYTQNYTQKLNWVLSMSQFTKWSTVLNSLSQSSSMHPIWRWRRLRGSRWRSWHIRRCRVSVQKLKFLPPYLCNAAFEVSWKKFYPVRTRFLICDQTVSECGFTANLMRMLIFPFSIQTDHYSLIIFAYIK